MESPWNKLKAENIKKEEELNSLRRFLSDQELKG